MEGFQLITPKEMDLLNKVIWQSYDRKDVSDVKIINYFLRYIGHPYEKHEIAWMLSYVKEFKHQFEKKGEQK